MSTGSTTARWTFVGVAVVIALIVALWPRSGATPSRQPAAAPATATQSELRSAAADAALQPCPAATGSRAAGPLAALSLPCLPDGAPVDLGTALQGRPAVVNLWAWWCGPCAKELPVLQAFAQQAGDKVAVLAVHSDPDAYKALQALHAYGVHLPAVEDAQQRVAALVGAPAAYPVTVLLRGDGTVAKVLPVAFPDSGAVASAVRQWLGVQV